MRLIRRSAGKARPASHTLGARPQRGQSMAEFALILTPLFLLLLGILQMGLVLNTYVTLSNAAREGARTATIYVYDRTKTKSQNDASRLSAAQASAVNAMGLLKKTPPQFTTSSDFTMTYSLCNTSGANCVTDTDTRIGQYVTVRLTYHQDLVIPMISALLPKDGNGRMPLSAQVTMVVN